MSDATLEHLEHIKQKALKNGYVESELILNLIRNMESLCQENKKLKEEMNNQIQTSNLVDGVIFSARVRRNQIE